MLELVGILRWFEFDMMFIRLIRPPFPSDVVEDVEKQKRIRAMEGDNFQPFRAVKSMQKLVKLVQEIRTALQNNAGHRTSRDVETTSDPTRCLL